MDWKRLINPWRELSWLQDCLQLERDRVRRVEVEASAYQREIISLRAKLDLAEVKAGAAELRLVEQRRETAEQAARERHTAEHRHSKELMELRERLAEREAAARAPVAVEFADAEPDWTPEHEEAWRHFLTSSEAGAALMRQANWAEQGSNRRAIGMMGAAEGAIGEARGWHRATQYFFHTLSAKLRPQQQRDTQATEADALRERLAS